MQTCFYNIHNIIKVAVNNSMKCNLFEKLNSDLSYFQVGSLDGPVDITINLGKFTPDNSECNMVDHKYQIKENYFYCKDIAGRAIFETEIFGFEKGQAIVNFNFKLKKPNLLNLCLPIHFFLLEGLITLKLAEKGYYLIHAACASKGKKSILFAGRGGSFKTSIVMNLIRKSGYKYMADDKVIIKDDKVYAFPLNITRFGFMLNNMENENYKNWFEKLALIKYLLSDQSNNSVPVEAESNISKLLMISKTNSNTTNFIQKPYKNEIMQKLIENDRSELLLHGSHLPSLTKIRTNPFYRYMLEYSYVFPESEISKHWDIRYNNFCEIFRTVEINEVSLPSKNINRTLDSLAYLFE